MGVLHRPKQPIARLTVSASIGSARLGSVHLRPSTHLPPLASPGSVVSSATLWARMVCLYCQARHRSHSVSVSALCQCSVRCVNVHDVVTATETLRGQRMCADSGRTYADIFQKINRQRKGERLRGTIEGSIAIERLRARGRGARR